MPPPMAYRSPQGKRRGGPALTWAAGLLRVRAPPKSAKRRDDCGPHPRDRDHACAPRGRGAVEGVAVRGGAEDRRADREPRRSGRGVLFETGYGPSGLPHIGTFGEVARTSMVRTRVPRPDRRRDPDAPPLLLRRHGRAPQGARQRAEPGDDAALPRPAADRGSGPLRRVSELRRRQQCAAPRASSTASASNTSSPAPPTTTARAASTRRS